ncbi:MAG: CD225/dispanin family protein [Candidatus Sulfotelmatobacter sp.]
MFCTQCGANNADNATVCVQCGRNLEQTPQAVPPLATTPQAAAVDVPNYLVFAILATVLCCLPAGIPAIVYAAQVNGKLQSGDIAGARAASNNAKMWCWISLGLGLAFCLIYGLIMVVGIMRHMNR